MKKLVTACIGFVYAISIYAQPAGDTVRAILVDENNHKWIGTNLGLLHFDNTTWKAYNTGPGIPGVVNALYYEKNDGTDQLWVGTNQGITLLDFSNPDKFTAERYTIANTVMTSDEIRAITMDQSAASYFATPEGLAVFESDQWTWLEKGWGPSETGVPNYPLLSLGSVKDTVYVGAESRGAGRVINEIDGFSGASYYEVPWSGMAGNTVQEIFIDKNENQWFGTSEGVSMHIHQDSKKGWEYYLTTVDGLISDDVLSIFEDSEGKIWMGTGEGLSLFDPSGDTFTNFTVDDGLADNMILDITEDRDNLIWFATANGITSYDGQEFSSINTAELVKDFIDVLTSSETISLIEMFGAKVYPNPAQTQTYVHLKNLNASHIQVHIADITGKVIKNLYDGPSGPGELKISWDLTNEKSAKVSPGIYIIMVDHDSGTYPLKILVK